MARQIKGAVVEHTGKDGRTYRALRFVAHGKRQYVSLGPVSDEEAQRELRHVLADVERGAWQPRQVVDAPAKPETPTFHEFAAQWWIRHKREVAASTQLDYEWRLQHLLRFFADYPVNEISFTVVDAYIQAKLAEPESLSPRSINMTLTVLGAILERARKSKLVPDNVVKGDTDLRVPEKAPRRTYLDRSEQIAALLSAAGELDAEARSDRKHISRRAIIATLIFAGLRIGELCALRWRDVDLKTGWLHVGAAKTDAGVRKVLLRGALLNQLAVVQEHAMHGNAGDFVFATRTGAKPGKDNLRNRVLAPVVRRANEQLVKDGCSPLPEGLTPHSLRRTFASVLYALGEDPGVVMDEMGHTHPGLALAVYRQTMRRGEDEKAALRALVEGPVAFRGSPGLQTADATAEQTAL